MTFYDDEEKIIDSSESISIKHNWRNIALNIVLIIACCVLFLLIYFASTLSPFASKDRQVFCNTPACLETASYILSNVDDTVKPCEDIMQYACGRFKPKVDSDMDYSLFDLLYDKNIKRFHSMLTRPLKPEEIYPNSSIVKMRDFYLACLDEYEINKKGGKPLMAIINDLGGWDVLGNWNTSAFDITEIYKKIHFKYKTNVFFEFYIRSETKSSNFSLIFFPVTWLYAFELTEDNFQMQFKEIKRFSRQVSIMLLNDLQPQLSDQIKDERINVFLQDLEIVFRHLHNMSQYEGILSPLSVEDLQKQIPMFNWSSIFLDFTEQLENKALVIEVYGETFMSSLDDTILRLPNRTLHNYFIWTIIFEYASELSSNYAKEKWALSNTLSYVHSQFPLQNIQENCINILQSYMAEVFHYKMRKALHQEQIAAEVGSLISNVTASIYNYVKNMLNDPKLERILQNKVENRKINGVTSPFPNLSDVDKIYYKLNVKFNDSFYNRLQLNHFSYWHYVSGYDITHPSESSFTFKYIYTHYRSGIINLPEMMLQIPLYDSGLPLSVKYSSLGTIIAALELNKYYYYGAEVLPQTSQDNSSICLSNIINNNNITVTYKNQTYTFQSYQHPYFYTFLTVTYIKRTLEAYKNLLLNEALLPGLNLTSFEQQFFLVFASIHCTYLSENVKFWNAQAGFDLNSWLKLIIEHIKEFREGFNCGTPQSSIDKSCIL